MGDAGGRGAGHRLALTRQEKKAVRGLGGGICLFRAAVPMRGSDGGE
jgi:hypothetical protein